MELKPSKEFVKTVEEYKNTELGRIGYAFTKEIINETCEKMSLDVDGRIDRMSDAAMDIIIRDCSIANDLDGTFMPYMQVLLEKLSKCFEEVS